MQPNGSSQSPKVKHKITVVPVLGSYINLVNYTYEWLDKAFETIIEEADEPLTVAVRVQL